MTETKRYILALAPMLMGTGLAFWLGRIKTAQLMRDDFYSSYYLPTQGLFVLLQAIATFAVITCVQREYIRARQDKYREWRTMCIGGISGAILYVMHALILLAYRRDNQSNQTMLDVIHDLGLGFKIVADGVFAFGVIETFSIAEQELWAPINSPASRNDIAIDVRDGQEHESSRPARTPLPA